MWVPSPAAPKRATLPHAPRRGTPCGCPGPHPETSKRPAETQELFSPILQTDGATSHYLPNSLPPQLVHRSGQERQQITGNNPGTPDSLFTQFTRPPVEPRPQARGMKGRQTLRQ